MTKLSLKINRKYKKFSCNQHYCLVPVIGLTGLLIRQPKRFRALLLVFSFQVCGVVPSPQQAEPGSGGPLVNWCWGFGRGGSDQLLNPGAEVRTGRGPGCSGEGRGVYGSGSSPVPGY